MGLLLLVAKGPDAVVRPPELVAELAVVSR